VSDNPIPDAHTRLDIEIRIHERERMPGAPLIWGPANLIRVLRLERCGIKFEETLANNERSMTVNMVGTPVGLDIPTPTAPGRVN
jgi:hypothetical protein